MDQAMHLLNRHQVVPLLPVIATDDSRIQSFDWS